MALDRRNKLLDEAMWLASSDIAGLWEIVGIANSSYPDLPQEERLRLAREVISALFARGWLLMYEREGGTESSAERPTDAAAVAPALASDDAWNWRRVRGARVQYLVNATERGQREFREDLRRRGIVR